jgi:lactate racemase
MQIAVPYGKTSIPLMMDESRVAGIIYPNPVCCSDAELLMKNALSHPSGTVPFEQFMSGNGNTLVIVNDGTRPTPTARILDMIESWLMDSRCEFIVATGMHRPPTAEEYRFIFGTHYQHLQEAGRIFVHDAHADDEMVYIGKSSNGTDMRINRKVMQADRIIVIGSVEPHYFAGYTGGRKSLLPGLASYDTITMNHKYALKLEARSLALKGNPVHEDMVDALQCLKDKRIFSIQTVLDRNWNIYAVTAGDIFLSMDEAVAAANRVFAVQIPQKEDIVISVAPYPMDVDLYQSQKAVDNGKLALNPDGILILVSKCRTGIGPDTFYNLMAGCDSLSDVMKRIEAEYKLGYHKAAKLVEIGLWAQLWAVTDLPPEKLAAIFMTPYRNIQEAVDTALKMKGPDARVLILMDGSITVPMIAG